MSLCIVHIDSFNICAPGTSVPTAEDDDEELVFAASQCEAQLNTGVAYDTNANIIRMFCENTLRSVIFLGKIINILKYFLFTIQNYVTSCLKRDAFFECTSSKPEGCPKVSVYLFAFPNLPVVKQSPDNFFTPLALLTHSSAPPEQTGWWRFIVLVIRGTVFPYSICVYASCPWASLLYT